jgi:hypothetical protein
VIRCTELHQIASSSTGEAAVAGASLMTRDPDSNLSSTIASPQEHNNYPDSASEPDETDPEPQTRHNRFQLPSSRIRSILAEAEASRSRSVSPNTLRRGTSKKEAIEDGGRGEVDMGWAGLKRFLKGDVGVVMRKRAEEGYGLDNVRMLICRFGVRADVLSYY